MLEIIIIAITSKEIRSQLIIFGWTLLVELRTDDIYCRPALFWINIPLKILQLDWRGFLTP